MQFSSGGDLWIDAEDGVVGGDAAEVGVGGVGADTFEEGADLPLPLFEVGAKDLWLLVVGDLGDRELLGLAADQPAPAADPDVPHPLGVAAGRDQVALAVQGEWVDRRLPPLAALATLNFEHPRAGKAEARLAEQRDQRVEDVLGEPTRLLEA